MRAFAKNNWYIIYGLSISFESMGSSAPSIKDFFPMRGKEGDKVTIHGDNFSANIDNNQIFFGDMELFADSASKTKLVVTLPNEIVVSGNIKIKCIVGNQEVVSDDYFRLEGVNLLDFYPKKLYGSDTIYIKCEDINPILNENIVKIGYRSIELISITDNIITGLIYYNENPGEQEIAIISNGKTSTADECLNILNTWETIISDYSYIRNRRDFVTFSVNGKGYVGTGYNPYNGDTFNDLWEYIPETNIWNQCAILPTEWGGIENLVGFSISDKGYVGLGHYIGN